MTDHEDAKKRWGCKVCPERFETLTEAWQHKRNVHGLDPFSIKDKPLLEEAA